MRSERERLLDILEAIERIEKYAAEGKAAFEANEARVFLWVVWDFRTGPFAHGKMPGLCLYYPSPIDLDRWNNFFTFAATGAGDLSSCSQMRISGETKPPGVVRARRFIL